MADIAGDGPPNKRQKIASPALTPSGSESGKPETSVKYLISILNGETLYCMPIPFRFWHLFVFQIFRKSSLILDSVSFLCSQKLKFQDMRKINASCVSLLSHALEHFITN